jgi:hypothetical protein
MKTFQQILKNDSPTSLFIPSLIATACGAGITVVCLFANGSLKSHPHARETGGDSMVTRANPRRFDGGSKTAGGTVLVHISLNGSIKPPEDAPWRHWLD